jgi:hypothetical protein
MNGPNDYENWLEDSGLDDTPENRGWYDCPLEESSEYIKDHPDWWNNA